MTTDDIVARQRAQLLEEAASLSWAAIWQRLAAARAELVGASFGLTDAQAAWRPPDGRGEEAWSISEVLRHLVTATPNIVAIIEATSHGRTNDKDPPGAISVPDAGVDELRERLVAASEELLSVGRRIPAQPANDVTVRHAFYGPLPCRAWPLFQAIHDGMHAAQIHAIRNSDGFPDS